MKLTALEGVEILLPYQKKWIEDESEQKIWEKSRRIGASWTEALMSVLKAGAEDGDSTYYLSYNKDMTKQFVRDCAFWAKSLNVAFSELEEIIIKDEGKDITTYRIAFASGAEIIGMPSTPHGLRSKQGRVVLDEAAFTDQMDEIIKAAQAFLIWGAQIAVLSTHNGIDSDFYRLVKEIRDGKDIHWSLHKTTFGDAIGAGLYKRICLTKGTEWTAKGEKSFVAHIYSVYKDNAREELDVVPRQGGDRYFPSGLIMRAARDDIPVRRLELSDGFLHERDAAKTKKIKDWFEYDIQPILASLESSVFIGLDFARSGDLSLAWIAEDEGKKTLGTRMCVELWNCPFEEQKTWIFLMCDFLKSRKKFGGIAIDSRGNGQYLGESAVIRYPGAAEAVMETPAWYAAIAPKLKAELESGQLGVPDDSYIMGDFSLMVLKNGIPSIPNVRTEDRGGKGKRHGDALSAALLCLYAWQELSADPSPQFFGFKKKDEGQSFGWWKT